MTLTRPSPLIEGLRERARLLPRALLRRRRPDEDATCSARGDYGGPFTVGRRARRRVRRPVPPREVLGRTGSRCWRNFTAVCARVAAGDPLPGDRHLRGPGGAPASRATSPRRPSTATRRWRPRGAWVDAGARFLHVVDLDGARTGSPKSPVAPRADHPRARGAGPVRRRTALAARRARRAARRRRARDPRHRRLHRRRLPRRRARGVPRARRSSRSTRAAATSRRRAGSRRRRCRPSAVIERLQNRGVRSFVYTNVDRDGMLEGPDLDEVRRIAGVVRGRFLYSGGIGTLERSARRCADAAPGQPRRRDRRQGAVRGPVHGPRGPGGARAGSWLSATSRPRGGAR